MAERRVEVPGGRLAVHDFGAGPPVVLLHAAIVDLWAWEPLTPFLLAAGYRVVAFDRRDAGGSVTADVPYSDRADTMAVMEALGDRATRRESPRTAGEQADQRWSRICGAPSPATASS